MRTLLIVLSVVTAGAALAADRAPRGARGTPYLTHTARLTAAGWKPLIWEDSQGCPDGDSRCELRPEVRRCSPQPQGECTFTWQRNNRVVEVVTVGREPARVRRTRCIFGDTCPTYSGVPVGSASP